ncbi:MAG: hypothetical protein U1D29_10145 [Burkholderiales bacterium]|nr:hypothetical protein [Burkholderiales bacterium]
MYTDPAHRLKNLRFSAKIDYLSIDGIDRRTLPGLDGKAIWPASRRGAKLTIHDPSATDLKLLQSLFPDDRMSELEVAVDIRSQPCQNDSEHLNALIWAKTDLVTKGLKPSFSEGTNSGFRGAYKPLKCGYVLAPFNRRVPGSKEQLLYGHRGDGAQVKVYLKGLDQKRQLPSHEQCVRMEVRLGLVGLQSHGLQRVSDLEGFRFRRELMPYFHHVQCTKVRRRHTRSPETALLRVLFKKLNDIDTCHWNSVGVGAFERGGRREDSGKKFERDTVMNQRIGQALLRLQRGLQPEKFVRTRTVRKV